MLNPKRSYSSYFDMEVNSRPRVPSLLRSASDSFALLKKPCFVNPGIGNSFTTRGFLEQYRGVTKFDEMPKHFENVSSNDNPISGIKVFSFPNSSTTLVEGQNAAQCRRRRRANALDSESNAKRTKRILANRLSAQRSRLRKLAYEEKLKMDIKLGEARVFWLSLQVSFYQQHHMTLKNENLQIKEMVKELEKKEAAKEAEFQSLKKEIEALREALRGAYMRIAT